MLKVASHQSGFTLIELMIAVAIIAILAGVGLPLYSGYVENSREAKLYNDISTIEVFQEQVLLRTGSYATGLANVAAITNATGWDPRTDDGTTYAITANGNGYNITATDNTGRAVCLSFPAKTRCN